MLVETSSLFKSITITTKSFPTRWGSSLFKSLKGKQFLLVYSSVVSFNTLLLFQTKIFPNKLNYALSFSSLYIQYLIYQCLSMLHVETGCSELKC